MKLTVDLPAWVGWILRVVIYGVASLIVYGIVMSIGHGRLAANTERCGEQRGIFDAGRSALENARAMAACLERENSFLENWLLRSTFAALRAMPNAPAEYVGEWTSSQPRCTYAVSLRANGEFRAEPVSCSVSGDSFAGQWGVHDGKMVWIYNAGRTWPPSLDPIDPVDRDFFLLTEMDGSRTKYSRAAGAKPDVAQPAAAGGGAIVATAPEAEREAPWLAPEDLSVQPGAGRERYVIGSYVEVRKEASATSASVIHLVANTPVTLLAQTADVCEIGGKNDLHGFVACSELGGRPLRIEEVGSAGRPGSPPDPHYSATRAFWLEPTVARLFEAGEHFRRTRLPPDQFAAEEACAAGSAAGAAPALTRFPIAEFEAMKALAAGGIMAPPSLYRPLAAWRDIRALIDRPRTTYTSETQNPYRSVAPAVFYTDSEEYARLFRQVELPPAAPSLFRSPEELGRPSADAEQLSAQYRIAHRVEVLGGPVWGGDNNSGPILQGAWDVGPVLSRLVRPVYEVAVGEDGQISIGETRAERTAIRSGDECVGEFRRGTAPTPLPGYAKIERPWIFVRLPAQPRLTRAKVSMSSEARSAPAADEPGEAAAGASGAAKHRKFAKAAADPDDMTGRKTASRIDLDDDGVADLFVWDDGGSGVDLDYHRQRLIFVNAGGQWYLLDTDEVHACGC